MGKTSFRVAWMEGRTWLAKLTEVVSAKSSLMRNHINLVQSINFLRKECLLSSSSELAMTPRRPLILSPEDQILNAEILQCLHSAEQRMLVRVKFF